MSAALIAAARSDAGCLAGVSQARIGRARWATAIDLLPVAVAALVAVGQRQAGRGGDLRWTLIVVVAFLSTQIGLLGWWGRSAGRLLLHLRTVSDVTGLPVTGRALLTGLTRDRRLPRLVTADLTRGRDPLAPLPRTAPAAAATDESPPDDAPLPAAGPIPRRAAQVADAVTLVFDTGRRQVVSGSLLIGRDPANSEVSELGDTDHPRLGMADPSRTLANTHALLEWSGSTLWVTDLNSRHGSTLVGPYGERRRLQPGIPAAAGIGWTVQCGRRFFSVHGARPPGVV